jgi:hypothetical protein
MNLKLLELSFLLRCWCIIRRSPYNRSHLLYLSTPQQEEICSLILLNRSISSDPSAISDYERGGIYYGVHVFTYTELEEATNNFDSAKELGDGGFGTVYYGKIELIKMIIFI